MRQEASKKEANVQHEISGPVPERVWMDLISAIDESNEEDTFANLKEIKAICIEHGVGLNNLRRFPPMAAFDNEPAPESILEVLIWICQSDHEEFKLKILETLLNWGVDVHIKSGFHEDTALHFAAGCGDTKIMQRLLEAGADIESLNALQWTPLHCAANNVLSSCKFLVEAGANIDSKSDDGLTPENIQMEATASPEAEEIKDYLRQVRLSLQEREALESHLNGIKTAHADSKAKAKGPQRVRI